MQDAKRKPGRAQPQDFVQFRFVHSDFMQPASFIIITGLSGSGKGTFLRALEDRGFFCVDNLPLGLLRTFHELIVKSETEAAKAAMVIDVREGQTLSEFPAVYQELRQNGAMQMSLWFLEASDAVLIRRFSETRRPHPLDPNRPVMEAIALERELLAPIRAMADQVLDTSQFTIHELRQHAVRLFEEREAQHLLVSLVSFGFKYGVPIDSDLVFDVRFLPNPNFVPHLKPHTGADSSVIEYMNSHQETHKFLEHVHTFIDFLLPQYVKEGKSYVTISIGCTGGRHRSVFIANAIAKHLEENSYRVKVSHRDSEKG
jgi:RNase adapter protein RapZ